MSFGKFRIITNESLLTYDVYTNCRLPRDTGQKLLFCVKIGRDNLGSIARVSHTKVVN